MSEINDNAVEMNLNDEVLLPDGWDGQGDIFDEASWGTSSADSEAPTTEPEAEATEESEESVEAAPTTEPVEETPAAPLSKKLNIKGKYNHADFDVDIDESDLPSIYQKSLAFDATTERLNEARAFRDNAEQIAREMGFKNAAEMLEQAGSAYRNNEIERLKEMGFSDEEAAEQYEMKAHYRRGKTSTTEAEAAKEETETPAQDAAPKQSTPFDRSPLANELAQLKQLRPSFDPIKPLPNAVAKSVADGNSLITAYLVWESAEADARNAALVKENKTLKQNAAAAARAPVTGVSGGGSTDSSASDPFLESFDKGWL